MLCACKSAGPFGKQSIDSGAVQHTLLCCKQLHLLVACMLCINIVLLSDMAPGPWSLFLASAISMPCMLCVVSWHCGHRHVCFLGTMEMKFPGVFRLLCACQLMIACHVQRVVHISPGFRVHVPCCSLTLQFMVTLLSDTCQA